MRRWLLVCLALAACAGPRSAPTPPGGLDVDGFRALMERSDRALARVRDRVVALVRGVLRRDALLRLDAGAESASAWAWTPKSNLAPRAGPPRGFHLGWIWIQEIQGWPLGQGQRRPPRHEKRTVSRHAGVGAPSEFDGHRLLRPLGRGGMGQVFLGQDLLLERPVALKFISAPDPDDAHRQRFLQEGRAIARLSHPSVVAIHSRGSTRRSPIRT